MKRWIWMLIILLTGPALAGSQITTVGKLIASARMTTGINSKVLIPDTVALDLAGRALTWVSTDCGGYEKTFRILTVEGQAFYAIQDSVVEILSATIVTDNVTKSIKAWYPQFAEETYQSSLGSSSGGSSEDAVPGAYHYWANSMQFIPIPIRVDSVYFFANYEHPTVTATTDAVKLKSPYAETAVQYLSALMYESIRDFEAAALAQAKYEKTKENLKAVYTRRFDVLQAQK